MAITFNKETRFVFAGDGMTDADPAGDTDGLGTGYVRMIRDYLLAQHPPTAPLVINRGGRGRIVELAAQWKEQVIAQRPDVLSLLFDLNPASNPPSEVTVDQYHAVYRQILVQTREYVPRCRIVFCQPPALWSKTAVEADEQLRPYAYALMELNREFDGEVIVPLHEAFVYARRGRPDVRWFTDQSTLTSAGHMLIAFTWMESCGLVRSALT
jgi:acyl-CoA thioesterase-1